MILALKCTDVSVLQVLLPLISKLYVRPLFLRPETQKTSILLHAAANDRPRSLEVRGLGDVSFLHVYCRLRLMR